MESSLMPDHVHVSPCYEVGPNHPPSDSKLVSLQSQTYTSLRVLMPSSPGTVSDYEISIKNSLIKQAAWAYLQPKSSLVDSSDRHLFRRMWTRFFSEYLRNAVIFGSLLNNIWVGWRHEGQLL
uniref:Uncharacterized protein n=1 Tax=Nelumbo nucifera TaxID=4432 RepID=A0A822XUV0_NELNU|nr:TPA_asm: hypothetical protein HUJ06_025570 [Nelumbo nucifera]